MFSFKKIFFGVLCASFFVMTYSNAESSYQFAMPLQQMRWQHLLSELRCLVCQNQSLAESNAPLAQDLKQLVADQIKMGYSDAQIKQYLAARYGEYILFKPSLNRINLVLWLGPIIFLCGASLIMYISIRRQISSDKGKAKC
jgi:cytochrome c-type biogenesis protein CcmH